MKKHATKLTLSRETLRALNLSKIDQPQLHGAKGGALPPTHSACDSYFDC